MTFKVINPITNEEETTDLLPGQYYEQFSWREKRKNSYDIAEQLGLIYDDIQAGVFGEDAKTGKFATYITQLKQQFPKG